MWERSDRATGPAQFCSWSKKPWVSVVFDDRCSDFAAADRQALASGVHGLAELVEQDLERPESLVEEVLGLVLQAT